MPISRFDLDPLQDTLARGGTVLVPSLRIKDAILAEIHGSQKQKSYKTPKVEPIDVWIKSLWDLKGIAGSSPCCDRQLMSASQELFVWTDIIEQSNHAIPLLNPEDTAAQVSQSYQDIQQWMLWDTLVDRSIHYQSNLDVSTFIQWAKSYQSICLNKQLIGLVDCTRQLIKCFEEGDGDYLPEEIVLSNFDDPPPLYSRLFESLEKVSQLRYAVQKKNSEVAGTTRYAFFERDQEIKSCAHWALELSNSEPDAHIGIIMPSASADKNKITRIFEELFDNSQTIAPLDRETVFNSTGESAPLVNFGIIHDALSLLSLFVADQDSNEVCRLLQSPFIFPGGEEIESLLQAQLLMRRNFSSRCGLAELSSLLDNPKLTSHSPDFSAALLQSRTLLRAAANNGTPRQWVDVFRGILANFQWPGDARSEDEKKLLALWDEGLNSFAESASSLGLLSHGNALKKLRTLLSRLSPRPGFSSKRQLSFYTVSESIGLRFDHAWLLGFDDQSWPPPSSPSPFLPYELQREHGMPASHGENQFVMAQQSFAALVSSVRGSLVYSHFESDGDQQFRASSFIGHINGSTPEQTDGWPLNPYCKGSRSLLPVKTVDDDCIPLLSETASIKGGQSILSNQSSCPFRAFAKHRLNADKLQEFSSGLSSMARGSALHIALEVFYSEIGNLNALESIPPAELNSRIEQASDEAIHFLTRHYKKLMSPRFSSIEHARLCELLSLFIDLDLKRESFEVIAQEKTYQWQHGTLQLTLKMDRIDKLGDSSLALIDYKTGKHTPTRQSWLTERPEDMQLPLYFAVASAIEDNPVAAVTIAHVNAEKIGFSGLAATGSFGQQLKPVSDDDKIEQTWAEITDLWEQRITLLAEEFVSGKANVQPVQDRKTCEYCGLQQLCRVQELRDSSADNNSEAMVPHHGS